MKMTIYSSKQKHNNKIIYKAVGGSAGLSGINGYVNAGGSSGGNALLDTMNYNEDTLSSDNIFNMNEVIVENESYINNIEYPEGVYGNIGGISNELINYNLVIT